MSRTKVKPIAQPDETSCGPTSLKLALNMLGIERSLSTLIRLCRTGKNGTSLQNLARAAAKCGTYALVLQNASLKHLTSSLKYPTSKPRAVIVNYLYRQTHHKILHEDSGHYSPVAGYSLSKNKIYLLDPYSAQKKSFAWKDFSLRWYDTSPKKYSTGAIHKIILNRPMIILARDPDFLPKFKLLYQNVYFPKKS